MHGQIFRAGRREQICKVVTPTSDPTPCLSAAPSADKLLLPTRALSDGKARPVWFKSPPWLGLVVLGFIWKYQQMPVVASGLMARRESLQGDTAAVYPLQEHLSMDTPCPASPQIPAASTWSLGSLQPTAEQETSLFFMELLAFPCTRWLPSTGWEHTRCSEK